MCRSGGVHFLNFTDAVDRNACSSWWMDYFILCVVVNSIFRMGHQKLLQTPSTITLCSCSTLLEILFNETAKYFYFCVFADLITRPKFFKSSAP